MSKDAFFKITSLRIQNFRCFNDFMLADVPGEEPTPSLGKRLTVLIGKNGAGKTTLLDAVKKGLSFIFADSKEITSISRGVKGVGVLQYSNLDGRFSWESSSYTYPISIAMTATYNDASLPTWSLQKNSEGGGLLTSAYKSALIDFYDRLKTSGNYPVYAYYSDSFPHVDTRISAYALDILKSNRPIPKEFGYYQWGESTSCVQLWESRLSNTMYNQMSKQIDLFRLKEVQKSGTDNLEHRIVTIEKELEPLDDEISYILGCLKKFASACDNAVFRIDAIYSSLLGDKHEIIFRFADREQMIFSQLPAGYKRLFSMVLDLAYRSYLLGKSSAGVVIVDEIELHLHPLLQQNVLSMLKEVFPGMQFIVSTHSPLILSNLKQDDETKVIQLSYGSGEYTASEISNSYGLDLDATTRDIMGVKAMPSDLNALIDDFLYLKEMRREEAAEVIYTKILDLVGEDSTVIVELKEKLKWL